MHAKRVLELYPNVDYYCASASYSLAHHKEKRGYFLSAIDDYLEIIEQYPEIEIIPHVMTKIAGCFLRLDRQAEAVYVFDTVADLYPYHGKGLGAVKAIDFLLKGRPDLEQALELARATGGANLSMKKLPSSLAMKLPPIMERLDKMKTKIQLVMIQNPEKGESIEDRVFNIK